MFEVHQLYQIFQVSMLQLALRCHVKQSTQLACPDTGLPTTKTPDEGVITTLDKLEVRKLESLQFWKLMGTGNACFWNKQRLVSCLLRCPLLSVLEKIDMFVSVAAVFVKAIVCWKIAESACMGKQRLLVLIGCLITLH